MVGRCLLLCCLLPSCLSAQSEEPAPMFPFKVVHGLPDNITNVQTWSQTWRPAGSDGFVRAESARFVTDRGPVYFSGTNICFSGCFPEHDQAEQVASDLARFGINLVRLHYVHHAFPPDRKYATPDSFIEPVQLEKFDYLFNQLKQRGIYVYFQLNIARKFGAASGFEDADKLPWYNNGLDNFEPRMIALQRKYIRDLLSHVNPYTGLAYKDEPAIATLELANENSVVSKWYGRTLDELPPTYDAQFQALWNAWLKRKYGTTAKLRAAWGSRTVAWGEEQIPDGKFTATPADAAHYPDWGLQHDATSAGTWTIEPGGVAKLRIERIGQSANIPQFFRRTHVVEDMPYRLTFRLRSTPASKVSVRISQDHDPWHVAGFRTTFEAGSEWQDYTFDLTANMTDEKVRVVFADFTAGTTIELAGLSLRAGGTTGIAEDETLEAGTVPIPKLTGEGRLLQLSILGDWKRFLAEVEADYFATMARTVKDEVKAPQPVTGTQLNYGFWYPQGKLDYCDIHSYWCHPAAPGGGSWTNPRMRELWFVRNVALVTQPIERSTLAQLAVKRPVNRPYTVSEYDHPFPNQYAAEGNPMLFAVGAFQDWSAIMHFAWTHSDDYDPDVMTGYFDMKTNSVKQVHFPACYAMFTRGDVRRGPGKLKAVRTLGEQQERDLASDGPEAGWYRSASELVKADGGLGLAVYSGLDLTDVAAKPRAAVAAAEVVTGWEDLPPELGAPDRGWVRNEFGELYWRTGADGYCQVDTPRTKLFTGFVRGRTFEFKGLTLTPGATRLDWTTVSLTQAAGEAGDGALGRGRYLLAATGEMQNTGEALKQVPPDKVSTASGYDGVGGTAPILCEGIAATVTLNLPAARVKCWALDQAGNRAASVPVEGAANAQIRIGPAYRTLWYELVVE